MIMFRPHRGGLNEAMSEAKEFETIDQMLNYICLKHNKTCQYFQIIPSDIYIDNQNQSDERVHWHNLYYLEFTDKKHISNIEGIKRYFALDDDDTYLLQDEPIGVIGMFTTDYN